jgi:hypothetical protein
MQSLGSRRCRMPATHQKNSSSRLDRSQRSFYFGCSVALAEWPSGNFLARNSRCYQFARWCSHGPASLPYRQGSSQIYASAHKPLSLYQRSEREPYEFCIGIERSSNTKNSIPNSLYRLFCVAMPTKASRTAARLTATTNQISRNYRTFFSAVTLAQPLPSPGVITNRS